MFSLVLWSVMLLFCFLFPAVVVARVARAVGSPRGRIRNSLAIAFIALVMNLALGLIAETVMPDAWRGFIGVRAGLPLGQLLIVYIVFCVGFQLSAGRALAPLAANFGVAALIIAVMLVLVRPFVAEAFRIPTASMSPTVEPGDRILVNKLATPRRWDLVAYVVKDPDGREVYCKRLVGLPGERLRFDNGQVYINDQLQQAPAVVAGRYSAVLPRYASPRYSDGETIQLGVNEFFFVGDNVDRSADSRIAGPSDKSALVGVVDLRYWPFGRFAILR